MLLEGFAAGRPTVNIPLSSQFPPTARVSTPFSFTLSTSTFSSDETFTYAMLDAPSWLSFDSATRTLSGTPPDWAFGTTPTMDIVATDGSGSTSMRSTLAVSQYKGPQVAIPIESQLQSQGENTALNTIIFNPSSQFSFGLSPRTFVYMDSPHLLKIFALTMNNTPLPSWISFDESMMTFSGRTPDSAGLAKPQERFGIRFIAQERPGFAGASIPFYIVVENHELEWDDTALEVKTFVGKPFEFNFLSESLKLDGKRANKSDILSIAATKLPSWLQFDKTTYVLSGTPQEEREGASPLDVTVSALDRYGGTATAALRVTLADSIFYEDDISSVDALIGQPLSYNLSQALVDVSAVNIEITITPAESWLSFDSKTLILSGDVSKSAEGSSINITMAATPKLALSKATPDSRSFTINVISLPLDESGGVHTSSIVGTEDSTTTTTTTDSDGFEGTTAPTAGASRHNLTRGELTAAVTLSILAVIFIAGILLYCGRRRRNRLKLSEPRVSKRDIGLPKLQRKFSILGLNGSRGSVHPGMSAKGKNSNRVTFDNPDPFNTKRSVATIRQSASSSKYSDQSPSHFNPSSRGHKDFCRPFQGTGEAENTNDDDDLDIIIIQNFPSDYDETRPHGITTAPSTVRTKGVNYSFHPYRATPRTSILQQAPEATCTTNTHAYRAHKRHRIPSDLGPVPNIPSNLHSGTGLQRTGSGRSERNVNRTSRPRSVYGNNQISSADPIDSGTWGSIPSSPVKSSTARPRSSLSVVSESTDVLYLGEPSSTTTTDDSPSLKSSSIAHFSQPLQSFLDMAYTLPNTDTHNSSPSLSRVSSRRGAGSSPFFSGTHRAISRVQSRSKKLFGDDKVAARARSRQVVPEPLAVRKLPRDENALRVSQDPALAHLLDGLGSSRLDSGAIASYTGSLEMTEDGTRRLVSFMAAVDKRKSWLSETDSRQSFSAWDFEQGTDGAGEVATGALRRFKSYKSTVSTRSKATFRAQSVCLGDEGQEARGATFMEQMAALEYCGGLFGSASDAGARWARDQWVEGKRISAKRLSAPLSSKSFELEVWVKQGGNDGGGAKAL
ncbi:hypothetical protein V493_07037 [Pseudogymnoascus sp. VKM F-4281 (FW-2241)]|nr:hypothetical protein V493_07037 [Pseudogymnoascus sp. VKM F-4281 (FW-2241)]